MPQCLSSKTASICLKMITTLREKFSSTPIAYSDHTLEADMAIAALSFGAKLIKKTITLYHCTPSVDNIYSLESKEIHAFTERLRNVEIGLGSFMRQLSEDQKLKRDLVRCSAFLAQAAQQGDSINDVNVYFPRPGSDIQPDLSEDLCTQNLKLNTSVDKFYKLIISDFQ